MQNEPDYLQSSQDGASQPSQLDTSFMGMPAFSFNYSMNDPATAPAYTGARPFWDAEIEATLAAANMEYGPVPLDIFQTPRPAAHHTRTTTVESAISHAELQNALGAVDPRLAHTADISMYSTQQSIMAGPQDAGNAGSSYQPGLAAPFSMSPGTGVDPGLLFSRPSSAAMPHSSTYQHPEPTWDASMAGAAANETATEMLLSYGDAASSIPKRQSCGSRATNRLDRSSLTSPLKAPGRPSLARSASESKSKRLSTTRPLPALAPAPRPVTVHSTGVLKSNVARSMPQNTRSDGRLSPLKLHNRLTSLASIPESSMSEPGTSITLIIDDNGQARIGTVYPGDESDRATSSSSRRSRSSRGKQRTRSSEEASLNSSDDYSSSSDEEPIIIPSRNTSFAMPEPLSRNHKRDASLRFGEGPIPPSTSFMGISSPPADGPDSDVDTIVDGAEYPSGTIRQDAESELRKILQDRRQNNSRKRPRSTTSSGGGGPSGHRPRFASVSHIDIVNGHVQPQQAYQQSGDSTISPTTLTDNSLPTPTSSRGQEIRCICNRPEGEINGDGFLVQCESCECLLHGRCINITRRTMPSVYICAFCANTPNMRGGRIRDTGRNHAGVMAPPGMVNSPLARKSTRAHR